MRSVLACSLVFAVACGSKEPPAASPTETASASASAASPSVAPAPADSVSPLAKKPLEVVNGCADVVTVVFGEDPKSQTASKRQIAPSATIPDAPRNNDGTQTVLLLDQGGAPIVKASVTKHMKRVEIGRSCRTIDAR